jgi:4-amino-4-deoxy-L-arabinose transferase-like glycosyltransferase
MLATLVSAVLLWGSWQGSIHNFDDFIYLQMAREMGESGNWMDLQVQAEVAHQRPPLAIWLKCASLACVGDHLFGQRFPAMAMALVALAFLFLLVRELTGRDGTSWLAVLATLATHGFYFNARSAMTDSALLAAWTGCLYFYTASAVKPRAWWGVGVAWGLALMSKGVVGLLLPCIVFVDLVMQGRLRTTLSSRWVWLATGAGLLVAAPWHVGMWVRHGAGFWSEYLGFNVLQRASSSLFIRPNPGYYIEEWLQWEGAILVLSWILALVLATIRIAKGDRSTRWTLVLAWGVVAYLPFQLSSTRIYHYVLPAMMGFSACVAVATEPFLRRRIWVGIALVVALCLFLANNVESLLRPDYSPDQRRYTELLHHGAWHDGTLLLAFNQYELAMFYQLRRPVQMWTDDPQFLAIVDSAPLMHRIRAVTAVSLEDLGQRLSRRPFAMVSRLADEARLCSLPQARGCRGPNGWRIHRGHYSVLVTNLDLVPSGPEGGDS